MTDLAVAVGLVLVVEGVLYALFPNGMKRLMSHALGVPSAALRGAGLIAAVFGLLVVWLVRG